MLRVVNKKCGSYRTGKFAAGQEAKNSDRNFLEE
jgi:hypothetical protein